MGGPDGIHLSLPGASGGENEPLEALLSGTVLRNLFWGFDVGALAEQLYECALVRASAAHPLRQVA
jgi:hypothetical protein